MHGDPGGFGGFCDKVGGALRKVTMTEIVGDGCWSKLPSYMRWGNSGCSAAGSQWIAFKVLQVPVGKLEAACSPKRLGFRRSKVVCGGTAGDRWLFLGEQLWPSRLNLAVPQFSIGRTAKSRVKSRTHVQARSDKRGQTGQHWPEQRYLAVAYQRCAYRRTRYFQSISVATVSQQQTSNEQTVKQTVVHL